MVETRQHYSYGHYLLLPEKALYTAGTGRILAQLGLPRASGTSLAEKALIEAAKYICTMKCGMCPLREEDFAGCQVECHDEIRPWQCWVDYLQGRVEKGKPG